MPEFKGAFDMPVKNVFDSYFKTTGWLITELAKQNANTHMINDMVEAGYAKKLGFSREGAKTDYVVTLDDILERRRFAELSASRNWDHGQWTMDHGPGKRRRPESSPRPPFMLRAT